jgi:hypothetical protein
VPSKGCATVWDPYGGDFTNEEIEELEWALGELWAYLARGDWDQLRFGLLGMGDAIKIIMLGGQIRRHSRPSIEVLREMEQIVRAKAETE